MMPTYTAVCTRLRLGAFAGGAVLALGAFTAPPAYAHDTLIGSTPEADEVLAESPEEVVLEFSGEGLTSGDAITNDIWVLDADEDNWAAEEPAHVDGSTLSTDIPEPLPNGEYEVHYRVVYSDGHSEELSFGFGVDDPGAGDQDDDAGTQPDEPDQIDEAAEPTESSAPVEDEQESDQSGGTVGWVALAVAVLALAGVIGYVLRRRRSQDRGKD